MNGLIFVQEGQEIDYTPASADVAAGSFVDVLGNGKVIGVAHSDIEMGRQGAVHVGGCAGVYSAPHKAETIAKGATVYIGSNSTDGTFVTTSTTGTSKFGFAMEACATNDGVGRILVMKLPPA